MKVSINWLKELVDLKIPAGEVICLLPLRTIGLKEVTDRFFELDMKGYNRADLLSMLGVALEVAAITDSKVNFSEEENFLWTGESLPTAKVKVENTEAIPAYCVAKIEGLKVAPSPQEWVEKLEDCGVRPVNNLADITNLIMLKYGQPLHAFDASEVESETLIARHAKPNEKLVTLDGKLRELIHEDLVIADPKKALGLAGVMGGKNSEITEKTTTILLEAAVFDPVTIRKTATRFGLQSEASKRFQHGLTKKRLLGALNEAIKMYQDLGGKLTALSLTGDLEDKAETITLNPEKMNSLIGLKIRPEEAKSSLEKLKFKVEEEGRDRWKVTVPFFRLDATIEADLIEEVARMHGYETILAKPLAGELPAKIDQSFFELISSLENKLAEVGLTQVKTYSFYSSAVINNLKLERDSLIQIANPMSSETEYLKDALWPNLLEKVVENLKYFPDVVIFEIGESYHLMQMSLPEERHKLALALSNGTDDPIRELFVISEQVFKSLGLNVRLGSSETSGQEIQFFHPTRFAQLLYGDKRVGEIAEVHPRIVNRFGPEKRIAVLEISLDGIKGSNINS